MARDRRKRRLRAYYKRTVRALKLLSVLVLSSYLFWIWHTGKIESLKEKTSGAITATLPDFGMVFKEIYVSGNTNLDSKIVLRAIGDIKGKPVFSVSLPEIRDRLSAIGWVDSVKLERQLPSTLHVIITERAPFAIWQHRKKIRLIDISGNVIIDGNSGGYTDLPIVVGEDANAHVKEIFSALSSNRNILSRVSSLIRIGNRRWNVRLKNGIEIKLPEEGADKAWENLLELQRDKKILDRQVKVIDLRLPDKVFIEPRKAGDNVKR